MDTDDIHPDELAAELFEAHERELFDDELEVLS